LIAALTVRGVESNIGCTVGILRRWVLLDGEAVLTFAADANCPCGDNLTAKELIAVLLGKVGFR